MGWLWSSESSSAPVKGAGQAIDERASSTKAQWDLSEEQRGRIFGKPIDSKTGVEAREAQADKELETFLASLSTSDDKTSSNSTSAGAAQTPQTSSPSPTSRYNPDGTLNIHPTALYPRQMSCTEAFDSAFYCQSLGGKFNDIYRFGSVQSCSEHWAAWRFCMRSRALPKEERERAVVEFYREREKRKLRERGSSEGVWRMRTKAVERAFWMAEEEGDEVTGPVVAE